MVGLKKLLPLLLDYKLKRTSATFAHCSPQLAFQTSVASCLAFLVLIFGSAAANNSVQNNQS